MLSTCLVTCFLERLHPLPPSLAVVLVMYPLIIPSPPRRTLLVALAATATVPLSILILNLNGTIPFHALDYLVMTIDPLICVAIAVFGSRVLHGMQQEVARAAELGSYRLQEQLGRGGMGEVWLAEHRLLSRPAAIKMMRPQVAALSIFKRLGFREELAMPGYVKDLSGERQDLIVMRCDLEALWQELESYMVDSDWQRSR